MTPIADMVRRMLEKGVNEEAILIAIEGAEQAISANLSTRHPPDKTLEKRRKWDREYRQSKRQIPPDSTRHPPDPPDTPLSLREDIERKEEEREGTPTRCPPDWQPSAEDREFAKLEGFADGEIDREVSKFRDYWTAIPGSKGVKLGWSGPWRKWVRDGADRRGKAVAGKPTANGATTLDDAAWNQILVTYKKFGHWSRDAGPDPDSPACRCPRELLEKHGIACAAENPA